MHINGVTVLSGVTLNDVIAEAKRWPLDPAVAEQAAVDVVTRARDMLDSIPESLADVISVRAQAFLRR